MLPHQSELLKLNKQELGPGERDAGTISTISQQLRHQCMAFRKLMKFPSFQDTTGCPIIQHNSDSNPQGNCHCNWQSQGLGGQGTHTSV
jgi:hypothetical protein